MMKLESVNQYKELIKEENVIMLFTANWCGDCRFLEPDLPEIEAAFPEYRFVEVDRDAFIDLCQELGILGIPSFVAYKEGEEVDRFVSKDRKTKEEVMNFIKGIAG